MKKYSKRNKKVWKQIKKELNEIRNILLSYPKYADEYNKFLYINRDIKYPTLINSENSVITYSTNMLFFIEYFDPRNIALARIWDFRGQQYKQRKITAFINGLRAFKEYAEKRIKNNSDFIAFEMRRVERKRDIPINKDYEMSAVSFEILQYTIGGENNDEEILRKFHNHNESMVANYPDDFMKTEILYINAFIDFIANFGYGEWYSERVTKFQNIINF